MIHAESKTKWAKVSVNEFVESHGGKLGDISIYGQEGNATTRRLAVMNLALRGIEADFSPDGITLCDPNRASEGAGKVFQKIYEKAI